MPNIALVPTVTFLLGMRHNKSPVIAFRFAGSTVTNLCRMQIFKSEPSDADTS
jgi:hypothetical protein